MPWTQDIFTDTDETLLQNHTPNIGAGWTKLSSQSMKIVGNEATGVGAGAAEYVTISADTDPNHSVECSAKTSAGSVATAGVRGRHNGTTTYYNAYLSNEFSDLRLRKTVAGVHTELGSYAIPGYLNTTYYLIKLICTDPTKKVNLDGTERISSANNDITTGNQAGIGVGGNAITYKFDSFVFSDVIIADLLVLDGMLLGDMSADMIKLLTIIDGILSGDDTPGVDPGPYRLQIFVDSPMTRTIDVVSTLR